MNLTDWIWGFTETRTGKVLQSSVLLISLCTFSYLYDAVLKKVLNVCFVSFSEQGNAYITCMPGPVRRWNHPVPLCIGGIHFFFSFLALVCIFARTYWDCVLPDLRILFDVAKQHSPFVSLSHTLFIDLLWFIPSVAFLASFISSRKMHNHARPHNVQAHHTSLAIASGKAIFSL